MSIVYGINNGLIFIAILFASSLGLAKMPFANSYSIQLSINKANTKEIPWNPYQSFELNDGIASRIKNNRMPTALPLYPHKFKNVQKKAIPTRNEGWNTRAMATLNSRKIKLEDRSGNPGVVAANPSMGLTMAGEYISNDIGFEIFGQYLRDEFKPDSNIEIQQHTDKYINVNGTAFARMDKTRWGLGMGMMTIPGFYTLNSALINSKHILVPYLRFAGGCQMNEGDRWHFSSLIALDYFLGAETDSYNFQSGGYKFSLSLNADYPLSKGSSFVSEVRLYYQDDSPKTHIQTELGFQFSLGVRWNFNYRGRP